MLAGETAADIGVVTPYLSQVRGQALPDSRTSLVDAHNGLLIFLSLLRCIGCRASWQTGMLSKGVACTQQSRWLVKLLALLQVVQQEDEGSSASYRLRLRQKGGPWACVEK